MGGPEPYNSQGRGCIEFYCGLPAPAQVPPEALELRQWLILNLCRSVHD